MMLIAELSFTAVAHDRSLAEAGNQIFGRSVLSSAAEIACGMLNMNTRSNKPCKP